MKGKLIKAVSLAAGLACLAATQFPPPNEDRVIIGTEIIGNGSSQDCLIAVEKFTLGKDVIEKHYSTTAIPNLNPDNKSFSLGIVTSCFIVYYTTEREWIEHLKSKQPK